MLARATLNDLAGEVVARGPPVAHPCLKTSLRFVIALFANLGDLDEILQLDINDWHSTFCKS